MKTVLKLLETTKTLDVFLTFGKIEFPLADITVFLRLENNANLILEEMSLTTIERQE